MIDPETFPVDGFMPDTTPPDAWADRVGLSCRTARRLPRSRILFEETRACQEIAALAEGWAYRFTVLRGGRRQILHFLLPGDMIGVELLDTPSWPYSVQALTDIDVALFDKKSVSAAVRSDESLRSRIWSMLEERVQAAERRCVVLMRENAEARIARLIIEIYDRLALRGLTDGASFPFPLRQYHVGEAVGLTPIHVNRVMGNLRAAGIVEAQGRTLILGDEARLRQLAGLDSAESFAVHSV